MQGSHASLKMRKAQGPDSETVCVRVIIFSCMNFTVNIVLSGIMRTIMCKTAYEFTYNSYKIVPFKHVISMLNEFCFTVNTPINKESKTNMLTSIAGIYRR